MDIKGIGDIYKASFNTSARTRTEKVDEKVAATDVGRDIVKISSEASFLSKVENVGKSFGADLDKGISSERMSELKALYKGDNTPVSGAEVANAVFGRIFGETV
ncbi:MAG: hypothetical protein GX683_03860 [Ruminococcaceae bacterium]|jgi:hypothetical protein|nr:hypothetical protein [Oscillospiraceae bacterium]